MKNSAFLKAFSCLLVLCLLSGCKPKSELLINADDDTGLNKETATLTICRVSSAENAEGDKISWYTKVDDPFEIIKNPEDVDTEPQGDMQHTVDYSYGTKAHLEVPFSRSFTVHSIYEHFPAEVSARNKSRQEDSKEPIQVNSSIKYETDSRTMSQGVSGEWSKVVYHCNNVTEIYTGYAGSKFSLRYFVSNKFPEVEPTLKEDVYDLNGSGGDHVIIALIDGEILTEGMEGNYTVSHYHRVNNNITTTEMEYDKDGNLLSATEE